MSRPRARWRIARSDVLWWAGSFIVLQAGLAVALETWLPSWRDPNMTAREERLRERMREHPGRPVVVVLGSSRTMNGICPAALAGENAGGGSGPLLMNLGFAGHGPIQLAVRLDHLIRDGVRPAGVVVEVVPALLPHREEDNDPLPPCNHCWSDLPTAAGVSASGNDVYEEWINARLMPWFAHRHTIMDHYLPVWQGTKRQDHWWKGLDAWGWSPVRSQRSDAAAFAFSKNFFQPLLQQAKVNPHHEKGLRHIFSLCKRERIPVAMLLMPESPAFRELYSPKARAHWDEFLGGLCREYDVRLIDAREWVPSEESFVDGHHLVPEGARAFTRRLAGEAIPALLGGGDAELARAD